MAFQSTPEQKRVIEHALPGHGRLLAAPGTGKSATTVALAERLLNGDGERPRLQFLTFTRAATAELTRKLEEGVAVRELRPSTIHSFSIATLLKNPGSAPYPIPLRIPDDYEADALVHPHLARTCAVDLRTLDSLLAEMAAKWESLVPHEHGKVTSEQRARFLGAWQEHRRIFGYTLLDELPDLLRGALCDHDDLLGVDFDLLIVDEYQDLNACDLEVLRRLADRGASVVAAGDDDQSIYSFRKAHPAGIREFLTKYGTDRDYKLTVCHRSPRRIIEWAQHVIQGDPTRVSRPSPSFPATAPDGMAALLRFANDRSESTGVVQLVAWLQESRGVPLSEILILSRSDWAGTFTRQVREKLRSRNLNASDPRELVDLMAEEGNRRLLAFLRLLANRKDSLGWWTLARLSGGLGDTFVAYLYGKARETGATFGAAWLSAVANSFRGCSSALAGRAMKLWNDTLLKLNEVAVPSGDNGVKWGEWIVDQAQAGSLPPCSGRLAALLLKLDGLCGEWLKLDRYLSQIQPLGQDQMQASSDSIRIMTMGGSKGLTVRATIIVGVDDNLIPREGADRSEERRLLYVAMTRSREYLFLTWAARRNGPGARAGRAAVGERRFPSEFLRGGPVESEDGPAFVNSLLRVGEPPLRRRGGF